MKIRRLAAAVTAAAVLSACGQTGAGVAARVGDDTIATSSFAQRVARTYENEQFAQQKPKDEYQRDLLGALIVNKLVDIAAQRLGVTITDEAVDAEMRRRAEAAGGQAQWEEQVAIESGIHRSDLRSVIRNVVLRQAVMDKLVEKENVTEEQLRKEYRRRLPQLDQARVAHILLRDAKAAARVAKAAKAPGADFAALAKRHSQDNETKEDGGDLGAIGNGQGRFAKEFEAAVFKAQTGDVVGPIRTVSDGAARIVGFEIIKVVERRTTTFEQARPDLRRSLLQAVQAERFTKLITDLGAERDIEVNPRFGRWDSQRFGVAPAAMGLSRPAPVPGEELPPGGVVPPAGQPPAGQPPAGQPPAGQPPAGQPPAGQPTAQPTGQ